MNICPICRGDVGGAGFLTVQAFMPGAPPTYTLCFPNREVAQSFGQTFMASAAVEGGPLGNAV